MLTKNKKFYIALIILSQSALSIIAGLLVFFLVMQKSVAPGVHMGDTYIGEMDRNQANQQIQKAFSQKLKQGYFEINYEDKQSFRIFYKDIDASLELGSSVDQAMGKGFKAFQTQFNGVFFNRLTYVYPVITINEAKLKQKITELSKLVKKAPMDANVDFVDKKVTIRKETIGARLNPDLALKKLLIEIPQNIGKTIRFNKGQDLEIEAIYPKYSSLYFEGAKGVLGRYSTEIIDPENEDSIKAAARAINKVVLFPRDLKRGLKAGTFSFNKYLAMDDILVQENVEGYNQVASTLNAAVLGAGIDVETIIRTTHKTTVDYIKPGLDALLFGNKYDYKFSNSTEDVLVIFTEVKNGKVTVSLVGNPKEKNMENSVEIEIVQRYDPSVVKKESSDLDSGEKRMVSLGKEGVKVNVFRTISLNGKIKSKIPLYHNLMYEAVKAVIETGPEKNN